MQWKIYHNPRCSKSRQALQRLRERGIEPEIVEYLRTPPDVAEMLELIRMSGQPAASLLRTGDAAFRATGLDPHTATNAELATAVAREPALLQRPIIVRERHAILGRPAEALDQLLEAR